VNNHALFRNKKLKSRLKKVDGKKKNGRHRKKLRKISEIGSPSV
jgi:hypothetical protein